MKRFITIIIMLMLASAAFAHVPMGKKKPANPMHCTKEYNHKGNGVSSKSNKSHVKTGRLGKIQKFQSSVNRVSFKSIK